MTRGSSLSLMSLGCLSSSLVAVLSCGGSAPAPTNVGTTTIATTSTPPTTTMPTSSTTATTTAQATSTVGPTTSTAPATTTVSTSTTSTTAPTTTTVPTTPAPVAIIIGDVSRTDAGDVCVATKSCAFRGDTSTGDGLNLYQWDWGDGTQTANAAVTTHTYANSYVAGPMQNRPATVTLTVRDRFNRTNTATKAITVQRRYE